MSKAKQIILPSFALFIICAVVSLALASTNFITKNKIIESEQKALTETLKLSVPDADEFNEVSENGVKYYKAHKNGETVAFVIETSAKGYGGDITVLTAISLNGEILKVSVKDASSETTGIGSKVTDEEFLSQFSSGIQNADAITGATYSSKGVKNAVNEAVSIFNKIGGAK